jgi:hypothetical protein
LPPETIVCALTANNAASATIATAAVAWAPSSQAPVHRRDAVERGVEAPGAARRTALIAGPTLITSAATSAAPMVSDPIAGVSPNAYRNGCPSSSTAKKPPPAGW